MRLGIKKMIVQFRGQLLESVTVSMGLAIFPDHGGTVDEILQAADSALYQAKSEGRDRVIIFSK